MTKDKAESIKRAWLKDLERTDAYREPESAPPSLPSHAVERKR